MEAYNEPERFNKNDSQTTMDHLKFPCPVGTVPVNRNLQSLVYLIRRLLEVLKCLDRTRSRVVPLCVLSWSLVYIQKLTCGVRTF